MGFYITLKTQKLTAKYHYTIAYNDFRNMFTNNEEFRLTWKKKKMKF